LNELPFGLNYRNKGAGPLKKREQEKRKAEKIRGITRNGSIEPIKELME
jgi:hypothetical protein